MNYSKVAAYQNAVSTVQKTRQVVLLYDAVIRFLQQSKEAIEQGQFEQRLNLLQKASNIIMGLHSALDYENGGEISQILGNFYSAMDLRISAINRTNNMDDLERILREVKTMRDAWNEIDSNAASEAKVAPVVYNETESNNNGSSNFSA